MKAAAVLSMVCRVEGSIGMGPVPVLVRDRLKRGRVHLALLHAVARHSRLDPAGV